MTPDTKGVAHNRITTNPAGKFVPETVTVKAAQAKDYDDEEGGKVMVTKMGARANTAYRRGTALT
jgi:hypothetical protein